MSLEVYELRRRWYYSKLLNSSTHRLIDILNQKPETQIEMSP